MREHFRSNIVGYVALFFALSGMAYALGANTVGSRQLKNDKVKSIDIGDGQVGAVDVNSAEVQLRIDDGCAAGAAIRSIAADGLVTCETDDASGGPPSGPAGGDLTGSYPDPTIGSGAVGTSEVDSSLSASDIADTNTLGTAEVNETSLFNDSSLDGGDINEAALGVVPSATRLAGTEIRQFSFGGDSDAVRTTILNNFHGLSLHGDCDSGQNAELFATTTAADAWLSSTKFDANGSDLGGVLDADFTTTDDHEVQPATIFGSGLISYSRTAQSTDLSEEDDVTVIYGITEHIAHSPHCAISGIAFGG